MEALRTVVNGRIKQTGDRAAIAYRDVYYALNPDHYEEPKPVVNLKVGWFTVEELERNVATLRDQTITSNYDYDDFLKSCE